MDQITCHYRQLSTPVFSYIGQKMRVKVGMYNFKADQYRKRYHTGHYRHFHVLPDYRYFAIMIFRLGDSRHYGSSSPSNH